MGLMDHRVSSKSEEAIASIASSCWVKSKQKRQFTFDIVSFILEILVEQGIDTIVRTRGRKKGNLTIKFFEREFSQDDPAYVEFDPKSHDNYVTLNVDRRIWELAQQGDSYACGVLAHEVGHILLHSHYANAFSSDANRQILFEGTSKEDFAEWQAITFAGHLMVPTHIAQKFNDQELLEAATNAPQALVRNRLADVRSIKAVLNPAYEGDVCARCSQFTLVRSGCSTRCDTCGDEQR